MASLKILLYILSLTFADNFLSHRIPNTFFQLIHPAWILLLTSSSHLPSLLTVEPRYLKFFAFFTFSPCGFNSSPSSHPQPSNIRSCSGSLSGLFSPVHFFKSPDPFLAPSNQNSKQQLKIIPGFTEQGRHRIHYVVIPRSFESICRPESVV